MQVNIHPSWKEILEEDFKSESFASLVKFVKNEYQTHQIFPPARMIFSAFDACPWNEVKVVILGQDPYHGMGQAHGLSFSVPNGVNIPPSLRNIFKELSQDLGVQVPKNGNLLPWAKQGVLLLNSTLTVRAGMPGSHQYKGWETFTDAVIERIGNQKKNVVFMLWGSFAQSKESKIDTNKNLVLRASHPSPFSAHRGFLGCKHFSQCNAYLKKQDLTLIDW